MLFVCCWTLSWLRFTPSCPRRFWRCDEEPLFQGRVILLWLYFTSSQGTGVAQDVSVLIDSTWWEKNDYWVSNIIPCIIKESHSLKECWKFIFDIQSLRIQYTNDQFHPAGHSHNMQEIRGYPCKDLRFTVLRDPDPTRLGKKCNLRPVPIQHLRINSSSVSVIMPWLWRHAELHVGM